MEAHSPGVGDLHLADFLLQQLGGPALVSLERKLHVLARHRIAVVESDALTEDELAGETAWHGLDQSVVEGVEHHERRDHPFRFPGIEPPGRERDVHPPGHGAFGRGVERTGPREKEEREREHRLHGSLPRLAAFEAPVNDRRGTAPGWAQTDEPLDQVRSSASGVIIELRLWLDEVLAKDRGAISVSPSRVQERYNCRVATCSQTEVPLRTVGCNGEGAMNGGLSSGPRRLGSSILQT